MKAGLPCSYAEKYLLSALNVIIAILNVTIAMQATKRLKVNPGILCSVANHLRKGLVFYFIGGLGG